MTTKIICDKCGDEIKEASKDHFQIGIREPKKEGDDYTNVPDQKKRIDKRIDLGSKCFKEFEEWLRGKNSEYVEMFEKWLTKQKELERLKKKQEDN